MNKIFQKYRFKDIVSSLFNNIFKKPIYLITHPLKGFEEFKIYKEGKYSVAIFYLIMMIVSQILLFNNAGFLVNKNNPKDFNLILQITIVVFPIILATLGNWSCTALMSGKGKMGEIFKVICYALFPYVWLSIIAVILSNCITQDETIIYTALLSLGAILTGYMIFFGLLVIHEYGLFRTIAMIILTIVAIAVILFICLLFLSLIQQFYTFVASVYQEFKVRFL